MDILAALVPPAVVAGAFIAIAIAVKRLNDREVSQDRADTLAEDGADEPD